MQAGTLAGGDVQSLTSRVLVNGILRPVLSWSVDRDIVGDLPEQVVAGGGVKQADGRVTWASPADVDGGALNPWNRSTGWIPVSGDRVQIFVGDGESEWQQFEGVIDTSSGVIGGGLESSLIDSRDKLSAQVNLPALMNSMPPLTSGGEYRRVGLSSIFMLNTVLRKSGFYSTPAPEFGCVLDVPMISSNWALVGETDICYRTTAPDSAPESGASPWGTSRFNFTSEYLPSSSNAATVPLQLTLMRTAEHAGTAYVRAVYGTKSVELNLTAGGAFAMVNGVQAASIPASGDLIVQLLYKDGAITLRSSTGGLATGTASMGTVAPMNRIRAVADTNARVCGMQVSHPTTVAREFASLSFTPSALVKVGSIHTDHLITPAITNRTASDVLDEITKATLRPFWIDEKGMAQVMASDRLYAQGSVQTVTTLDDIRELAWETSLLGVRSLVRANYDVASVSVRRTPSVTVWESSEGAVLQGSDVQETVIEPSSGEDWVMVDDQLTIPGVHTLDDMNKGIGSIAGGVYTDGASETWASFSSVDKLTTSISKVGASRWVITSTGKAIPAGYQVELRTLSQEYVGSTVLWPFWRGRQLPMIRANGKAVWDTRQLEVSVANANKGPELVLDCGPWLTGNANNVKGAVEDLVSYVAGQVANPAATITGMRVGYDPRRQLGDVITISSPNLLGVELKCLIVGIQNAASGQYTQSLSVRIISAKSIFTTYDEFAQAWGNAASYDTFAAAWTALSTYGDFNNDPLRGTA